MTLAERDILHRQEQENVCPDYILKLTFVKDKFIVTPIGKNDATISEYYHNAILTCVKKLTSKFMGLPNIPNTRELFYHTILDDLNLPYELVGNPHSVLSKCKGLVRDW